MKLHLDGLLVIALIALVAGLIWLLHEVVMIRREVSEIAPPRFSVKPVPAPTSSGFQIPPPPY